VDDVTIASHYAADGPVAAAFAFFAAVCDKDFDRCWMLWSTDLRRTAAEQWVHTNLGELQQWQQRDRDEFVAVITDTTDPRTLGGRDRDLWRSFEYTQLHSMTTEWAGFIEMQAAGRLGAGSATRLVGPDVERVILTETDPDEPMVFDEPTLVAAIQIDVCWNGDSWRIADVR
jgi:hypothetical protein